VLGHLLNHALGLVSYQALLAGGYQFLWFWRLPPVQFLLYAALAVHVANALYALATLRAPRGLGALEIFRLLSGFALPPL
ncbi:adenylate/guanylate cyclase domain-containing protein, partial [Salmonella enterica]